MPDEPYHWQDRAACRDSDLAPYFYDMSSDPAHLQFRLAALCASCPVFDDCRSYIDREERGQPVSRCHGFWAGETVKQRYARRHPPKESS